jgi:hypothetical protein
MVDIMVTVNLSDSYSCLFFLFALAGEQTHDLFEVFHLFYLSIILFYPYL